VVSAFPLRAQHLKNSWLGIRILCPSGTTSLSVDCCFSELTLLNSTSRVCLPSTERKTSLSHWNVTCSRHDIAENIAHFALKNNHSLTHLTWLKLKSSSRWKNGIICFLPFFFELVDVLIVFEVYMYDTPKCEIRFDKEFFCTFGYVLTFLLFQRCMLLVLYIFQFSRNSRWIEWVRDCRETCKLEVIEPTSLVWIQNTYHIQNNVKTADLFSIAV
jgi:hypothetical protein